MSIEQDHEALGILHAATIHLRNQFCMDWPRELAKANLDARALLFGASNVILAEHHMGISREEIEGAQIIERNA